MGIWNGASGEIVELDEKKTNRAGMVLVSPGLRRSHDGQDNKSVERDDYPDHRFRLDNPTRDST